MGEILKDSNGSSVFKGYLIKASKTGQIFNPSWMLVESYDSTPNIREECKAVRDENTRDLTRVTASGMKTAISFKTMPCNLYTKAQILKFFTDAEELETDKTTAHLQRKIKLIVWDDETSSYKSERYFYRPDIKFTIRRHTDNDIIYNSFEINLIEY